MQIQISYIELPCTDISITKEFYKDLFQWNFTDYGPNYTAFTNSGLEGGFYLTDTPVVNGALIVLYANELEKVKDKITIAGGKIIKEIFEFPGGRRFHFLDPSGNELAIWSE